MSRTSKIPEVLDHNTRNTKSQSIYDGQMETTLPLFVNYKHAYDSLESQSYE